MSAPARTLNESLYKWSLSGLNCYGIFALFFYVWFNPHSQLNILSFTEVAQKFRVTMDTAEDSAIVVHIDKNKVLKFK